MPTSNPCIKNRDSILNYRVDPAFRVLTGGSLGGLFVLAAMFSTSLALSVARWVHNSAMATFSEAPYHAGRPNFPGPVGSLGLSSVYQRNSISPTKELRRTQSQRYFKKTCISGCSETRAMRKSGPFNARATVRQLARNEVYPG
jgi:hypothetical protein